MSYPVHVSGQDVVFWHVRYCFFVGKPRVQVGDVGAVVFAKGLAGEAEEVAGGEHTTWVNFGHAWHPLSVLFEIH